MTDTPDRATLLAIADAAVSAAIACSTRAMTLADTGDARRADMLWSASEANSALAAALREKAGAPMTDAPGGD